MYAGDSGFNQPIRRRPLPPLTTLIPPLPVGTPSLIPNLPINVSPTGDALSGGNLTPPPNTAPPPNEVVITDPIQPSWGSAPSAPPIPGDFTPYSHVPSGASPMAFKPHVVPHNSGFLRNPHTPQSNVQYNPAAMFGGGVGPGMGVNPQYDMQPPSYQVGGQKGMSRSQKRLKSLTSFLRGM